MRRFPVCQGSQVIMPAHQFTNPAPETRIQPEKLPDVIGSEAVISVNPAAERKEPLLNLLRLCKKLLSQDKVRAGIMNLKRTTGFHPKHK